MDHNDGYVYLSSHDRDLISTAIVAHIRHIASLRDQCEEAGIAGYDFNWQIQNYQAVLKHIVEE